MATGTMDVFALRDELVDDYRRYAESFLAIADPRIRAHVQRELDEGLLWPDPPLQLNPAFASGGYIDELVEEGVLRPECRRIFRVGKSEERPEGERLRLHRHQADAIRAAQSSANFVVTTGTGSGKSLSYIVPIVDYVLRGEAGDGRIKAIVVYPMNALANSQEHELAKFLELGFPDGSPVSFRRYTGQEGEAERDAIRERPPDILLTNYVMLEYLLTRPSDRPLIRAAEGLSFLVLDELHTYRGRQGADVALLVRRVREACRAERLRCVGTSATMAGSGAWPDQQRQVAKIASRLFGAEVRPHDVIGETLSPVTADVQTDDEAFRARLSERVREPVELDSYEEAIRDPLVCWIEQTLGVALDEADGRYVRCPPRPLRGADGAAELLAEHTGVEADRCLAVLERTLLAGSRLLDAGGFPLFAFRLHQFFSGGNVVAASLDPPAERAITTSGQQYVQGSARERVFMPLAFCRECGQDYFPVRIARRDGGDVFEPREVSDRSAAEDEQVGYLYVSDAAPWPDDEPEVVKLLPADWVDPGSGRIRRHLRPRLPRRVAVDAAGRRTAGGLEMHFVPAPFRFCLNCGVAYSGPQTADYGKLATLGAGGRSTSTTVLGLSAVQQLRREQSLPLSARKLLSFSDNRQDASLQAGHFNDFVEIGLLRSAVFRAMQGRGEEGLRFDDLPGAVFEALALPPELYAIEPELRGGARRRVDEAMREVLAYRVYRDQQRGWRLTSPNLEQTGLLHIEYDDLRECVADEDVWSAELPSWVEGERDAHALLVDSEPATRAEIARVLLDYMRRELAIKIDVLDPRRQEEMRARSRQHLIAPWAIDEDERPTAASVVVPRSRMEGDVREGISYLSPLGGYGRYLRRKGTFPLGDAGLTAAETQRVIVGVLEALRRYGLVEVVAAEREGAPGYQVPAAQLLWLAADGERPLHDPIRRPRAASGGGRTNAFFVDLYRETAATSQGIEAREHTAQVRPEERERREEAFRAGALPVLFCSPTMELGVDIASLNVVNLRNVPPTPANYAQRSGRAGRHGQPALVYTFCSTFNSHDQYFFRRPERMVAGQVSPPQLDLANEDLIRAHVHAIWLAETRQSLGRSLTDVLDVEGEDPSLELRASVRVAIESPQAHERAVLRAARVLEAIGGELTDAPWWDERWLDRVLARTVDAFDRACDRWRDLYRSARRTSEAQQAVILDASRPSPAKNEARRLRREAEAQLELLTLEGDGGAFSDFYSYRYFATEGFLPGYSFPRLPLAAFIPGRSRRSDRREDFVQRPRFLAITEFGPRSVVYHEGGRFLVNKVILPVGREPDRGDLPTERAKLCETCGYLHRVLEGAGPAVCERCSAELDWALGDLLRLQNVSTRRRDRISSDEEERQRQGYDLRTAIQFTEHDGRVARRTGHVAGEEGEELLRIDYGQAATIWRVNLGWTRRRDKDVQGFVLDVERGYWAKDPSATADDPDDPLSHSRRRVIPFVEDRRNCVLIEPKRPLDVAQMASLQAALKRAIQATFQLEEQELAAEPLPSAAARNVLLLYEAAEGGAGVLRRLIDIPGAMAEVAQVALELCHFDPDTGEDLRRARHAREDCEVACYDCLLSYGNQRDHRILDRGVIRDVLLALARASTSAEPAGSEAGDQAELLRARSDTDLERRLVDLLVAQRRRLPDAAQQAIAAAQARPDFVYAREQVAVFVDGPLHDESDKQRDDERTTARLEELGWEVVRFHHGADWTAILDRYPSVFGGGNGR